MKRLLTILAILASAAAAFSQEPPKKEQEAKTASAAAKQEATPPAKPDQSEPKPYDKVVTSDFKTQAGIFKAHTSKGKLLLEIPRPNWARTSSSSSRSRRAPARPAIRARVSRTWSSVGNFGRTRSSSVRSPTPTSPTPTTRSSGPWRR